MIEQSIKQTKTQNGVKMKDTATTTDATNETVSTAANAAPEVQKETKPKARKASKKAKARKQKDARREYDSTPKLTCVLTGQSRTTNMDYLAQKATRHNCTVEDIVKNYISRDAQKLLAKGKTVSEIQEQFKKNFGEKGPRPISEKRKAELIHLNSKTSIEKAKELLKESTSKEAEAVAA